MKVKILLITSFLIILLFISSCNQKTYSSDLNQNTQDQQIAQNQENSDILDLIVNSFSKKESISSVYTAEQRYIFLVVDFTIKNNGIVDIYINPGYFKIKDSNGYSYDYNAGSYSFSNAIRSTTLKTNDKLSGILVFEIPKSSSELNLIFDQGRGILAQVKIEPSLEKREQNMIEESTVSIVNDNLSDLNSSSLEPVAVLSIYVSPSSISYSDFYNKGSIMFPNIYVFNYGSKSFTPIFDVRIYTRNADGDIVIVNEEKDVIPLLNSNIILRRGETLDGELSYKYDNLNKGLHLIKVDLKDKETGKIIKTNEAEFTVY